MYSHSRKNKEGYAPLLAVAPPPGRPSQYSTGSNLNPMGAGALVGRRISPAPERGRFPSGPRRGQAGPINIGQPGLAAGRQRDKFVPLPEEDDEGGPVISTPMAPESLELVHDGDTLEASLLPAVVPSIFEDLPRPPPRDDSRRGRITFYCIAESFDRKKLDELLRSTYPPSTILSYPDAFYIEYIKGADGYPGGDCFFFDYGVVACWGLTKAQEMTLVRGLATQVMVQPLPNREFEVDEFQFNYTTLDKPHVQNDTVTLHKKFAQDHKTKLAISYALAQSTKLSVYEKRVTDIVLETKHLPEALAEHGKVDIGGHDIAKLIGKVFLQKSAVNLLGSVLGTPEFFWHENDSLQALYTRLIEYLELGTRVELLNSRFTVLQEMLDMLRDHQNNSHNVRLEWIVIWLIVVEVVVGLLEVLGLFGLVGVHEKAR